MAPVEHGTVDKHQCTLEYGEECLVSDKRRQGHRIEGRDIESLLSNTEVLDGAEDRSDKDENDACVES